MKPGYKQTEVGVIPEEWSVWRLGDLLSIKGGIAYSSEHFSDKGPILLTPGNFKLDGGLYFNDRNTKRYSGAFGQESLFKIGDLLVVMTDLTPECSLLGKPAIVKQDEPILHNQRIGKISLSKGAVTPAYLYRYFLSAPHAKRMKDTATGSTVRHTSNESFYSSHIAIPSTENEQNRITTALSDADALIESLEQVLAKKRDLKQGAMQKLLTGKTRIAGFDGDWVTKRLGQLASIQRGASPRPIDSSVWFDENSTVGWVRISDVTKSGMYLHETTQRLSELGIQHSRPVAKGSLIMSICATVGRPIITTIDTCIHDGFVVFDNLQVDKHFIYYALKSIESNWSLHGQSRTHYAFNLPNNLPSCSILAKHHAGNGDGEDQQGREREHGIERDGSPQLRTTDFYPSSCGTNGQRNGDLGRGWNHCPNATYPG